MNEATQELAPRLRAAATLAEKVALLRDAYHGRDCWLIATGPSATALDMDRLRERLKGELVVAIKQAYDLLPGMVDFHVVNPCNLKAYQYADPAPVSVAVIWPPGSAEWDARWDLSFRIPRCGYMKESVCWTKQFDRWTLDKTLDRPWGPGIMHEIGLYLPVHFGCKRILTLGFDLEPGVGKHFYADKAFPMTGDTVKTPVEATGAMLEWLRSLGIECYRIATTVGSQLPMPTISLEAV